MFESTRFPHHAGPTWNLEDFDFDRDYKRLQGVMESAEPTNPDLRKFKDTHAKLLVYTGWSDSIEVVLRTVDYYETVERLIGGRAATQSFFQLFVIPGMDHCWGGDGAYAVDYLTYLERWVEQGHAPDELISSHLRLDNPNDVYNELRRPRFPIDPSRIAFSRPVYPYPLEARYLGHGDPRDASSFGPTDPQAVPAGLRTLPVPDTGKQ
jgi:hypothetical protein